MLRSVRLEDLELPQKMVLNLLEKGFDLTEPINPSPTTSTSSSNNAMDTKSDAEEVKKSPLKYAIDSNNHLLEILLDASVDLNQMIEDEMPALFYCICAGKYTAFKTILVHPHADTIDFSYYPKSGNEMVARHYTILMHAIDYTFGREVADDELTYQRNIKFLRRLLTLNKIDLNQHVENETALTVLFGVFDRLVFRVNQHFPDFLEIAKKLILANADLNANAQRILENKTDQDAMTPIGRLFEMHYFDNLQKNPNENQQQQLAELLQLLLKQNDNINLNVFAKSAYRSGTPLMIAFSFNMNEIINMLRSNIREQCLGMLWNLTQKANYNKAEAVMKMDDFLYQHAPNQDTQCQEAKVYNSHLLKPGILSNLAKSTLDEEVRPFVTKMMSPQSCLGDIVYADSVKTKLRRKGYDLKEGFKQQSDRDQRVSLLACAASHAWEGLIWCLALQPSFHLQYSHKEIFDTLTRSIDDSQTSVSHTLATILFTNLNGALISSVEEKDKELQAQVKSKIEKMLLGALEKSVLKKNARLIRYFTELYHKLGGFQKLGFELLQMVSIHKSILTRSLQIQHCPYVFNEYKKMLFALFLNGLKFNPNENLTDDKLKMDERVKAYTLQFIERHQQIPRQIEDQARIPMQNYYINMGKHVLQTQLFFKLDDLVLYPKYQFKYKNEARRRGALTNFTIAHILSYLSAPFEGLVNIKDVERLCLRVTDKVIAWYGNYLAQRRNALIAQQTANSNRLFQGHRNNQRSNQQRTFEIDGQPPRKKTKTK